MDQARIEKVLLHLLENAANYSPVGTPIIVSAEMLGARVSVSVADRGPGIDDLERLLEADPQGGRHRVMAAHAPVVRAVLRAAAEMEAR